MNKRVLKIIIILLVVSVLGTGIALYKVFSDKTTYRDIEVRTTDDYVQYRYKDSNDWNNLVKLETLSGKNNKEVEIKKDGNFIKWKYTDDKDWTNLIDLTSLIGQDGKNGKSGKDGREIEVSTNDGYIVYRYKGDKSWTRLIKLSSLNGNNGTNGKEVEITKDDTYIKWRYKGDTTWNNLIELGSLKGKDGTDGSNGTNGNNGVDGKEVELKNDGTDIKWRYKGDTTWNTLTSIASLKGEKGDKGDSGQDGEEIELKNDGTYIKWKYKNKDGDYTNLIDIETLKGKDGLAWINLGVVDVSPYCMTYNEGEENEYEDCGYFEYLKLHFPDAEEGNYIFTDNSDYFVWHVKVEKAEMGDNKFALIEYWSTEETYPYFIQAYKWSGEDKWETYDLSFVRYDDLNYYVDNLRNSINSIDYQYLATVNVTDSCGNFNGDCSVNYIEKELVEKKLKNGKYIFKDNEDGDSWIVEVEIANTNSGKTAYVEYWDTEETFLYFLKGWYNKSTKKWTWNEPSMYASYDDVVDLYKNYKDLSSKNKVLESRIESLGWKNLGSYTLYCDPLTYLEENNLLETPGKYIIHDEEGDNASFLVEVIPSNYEEYGETHKLTFVRYLEGYGLRESAAKYEYVNGAWEKEEFNSYDQLLNYVNTQIGNQGIKRISVAKSTDHDAYIKKYFDNTSKLLTSYNRLTDYSEYQFTQEYTVNYVKVGRITASAKVTLYGTSKVYMEYRTINSPSTLYYSEGTVGTGGAITWSTTQSK